MLKTVNHFAALLDPVAILSACSQSRALADLPVSATRDADRAGLRVFTGAAESDAAAEEAYRRLIEKAARKPTGAKKAQMD